MKVKALLEAGKARKRKKYKEGTPEEEANETDRERKEEYNAGEEC